MAKKEKQAEINIEDIELDEAPAPKTKKTKKKIESTPVEEPKAKKSPKTTEPKATNKISKEIPEGYITAEEIAEEFGKKGRDVRQVLRDNEFTKPSTGRWAWSEKKDASTLKRLRGLLGGTVPKVKKEKAEVVVETPAPKKKKSQK